MTRAVVIPSHSRFQDLTGKAFGRWVVIRFVGQQGKSRCSLWLCRCRCGAEKVVSGPVLTKGASRSCGCLFKEIASTHGRSKTSEYRCWMGAIRRCYNKHTKDYPDYGGRGITVCDRWRHDFAAFLADMGHRPSPRHSIERKDTDGPYSPENCCWATAKEQGRNKRNNRLLTFRGTTCPMSEWAELLGISLQTISSRIHQMGWPPEKALSTPVASKRRNRS